MGLELALAPSFREDFRESLYRMVGALTSLGVTIMMTAEVVDSFPLGGIQDETVYGICVLPDEFDDPRQPFGSDPYEFWRRAGASPAVTPIRV